LKTGSSTDKKNDVIDVDIDTFPALWQTITAQAWMSH